MDRVYTSKNAHKIFAEKSAQKKCTGKMLKKSAQKKCTKKVRRAANTGQPLAAYVALVLHCT